MYYVIYYFDLDVQFNSYPVSNKVKDCSFPTVSNVFFTTAFFHSFFLIQTIVIISPF